MMRHLILSLVLTIAFAQIAFSRPQRRMARPNPMREALQNMFLPGAERDMPRRTPGQATAYESKLPFTQMPRNTDFPNLRVFQPPCGCQQEVTFSKSPERIPVNTNIPAPMRGPVVPAPVPILPAPVMTAAPIPTPTLSVPAPQFVPETLYSIPLVEENCGCPCSTCSSPAPLVSPFLPAASPVSAWAPPTSSLLPSVVPSQSRSHFLRKIPIPPPTL